MTPASVGEAYDCLAAVSARLRSAGDPRAAFTDVYAVITRRVRDVILGPPAECPFVEPEFISRLAGRFCTLYLASLRRSLDGTSEPIRGWGVANRREVSRRALPFQHALLGLNAHINYDLALGLFDNVISLDAARDGARLERYHHDHDAVNRILEDSIPEVMSLLARRHGCGVAVIVLRTDELLRATTGCTMLLLRTWRGRVWREVLALLAAPDERARGRLLRRMNARAGIFANLLRWPVPAATARDSANDRAPSERILPVAA